MDGRYLIPANSKSGQLIFNIFRPFDIILFLVACAITLILLVIMPVNDSILLAGLAVTPAGIGTLLVLPIPNYHNVMVFLGELLTFYNSNRVYLWRGWCIKDDQYEKTTAYNRSMVANKRN